MADAVASSVNLYLQKLDQIRKTLPVGYTGDHFALVVIGYGPEPARQLLYMDSRGTRADEERTRYDASGASSDNEQMNFPFWVKPAATGEATLCHAFASAYDFASSWVQKHSPAEPPNVIHITDGTVTDGDPREIARRTMELATSNGNAAVWNCLLAARRSEPVLFPTEDAVSALPEMWKRVADASSVLPRKAIPDLLLQFPEVSRVDGARCCVFNADLGVLVRAISSITRLPLP